MNVVKVLYITICIFIASCGADTLKKSNSTKTSAINNSSVASCLCTSDFSPVCGGTDKKSYENACLAKCFGNNTYTAGNCQCNADLMVCGVDGQSYTECEARTSKITIKKYVACDYAEL
jgi:hypothetical protein